MTKHDNERNYNLEEKKKRMAMTKNKKRNVSRLGGSGLSLDAFANAKSNNSQYNPSLIKKQRELYKNAKNVQKYKKMLKQHNQHNDPSVAQRHVENLNETEANNNDDKNERRKRKKDSAFSLEELYKKQHEEKEKERMEREAIFQEKKEQREKAEAHRKTLRQKMLKKTRKGQPVMKYRIEHLLETIQSSTKNAAGN
ncbi:unnamed protein product [Lathyrus sativus]|nr:unnamed protein product [Lathyrus sativus]